MLILAATLPTLACAAPAPAPARVAFICHVEGAKRLGPAATPDAACARMRILLGRALGYSDHEIVNTLAANAPDVLRVELGFRPGGIAVARATRVRAGVGTTYPEVAIARSDRPLGLDVLDGLARDLASAIARADALRKN